MQKIQANSGQSRQNKAKLGVDGPPMDGQWAAAFAHGPSMSMSIYRDPSILQVKGLKGGGVSIDKLFEV